MSDLFPAAIEAARRNSSNADWAERCFLNIAKDHNGTLSKEIFFETDFAKGLGKEQA